MSVEEQLQSAARTGCDSKVSSLLRDHPDLNINYTIAYWTALHFASFGGHLEIAKLLLVHPGIDVNKRAQYGKTPLSLSCSLGHTEGRASVLLLLLKDLRVDVTLDDDCGCTPLWHASCNERYEIIEWLIASGKDLGDIQNKKGRVWDGRRWNYCTALEISGQGKKSKTTALLERFITNPDLTRYEIRAKLRIPEALAAQVFALTVFLCDELLQFKPISRLAATPNRAAAAAATRFFAIAAKLPMELQMILSHKACGSTQERILNQESELAFKALARALFLST